MVRKSVLQSLTRWLSRPGGQSLGIALGGGSCRYVMSDYPDRLFQEPSLIVRCRSDGSIILNETSIGDVARETLVCKNVDRYEYKQIFADVAAVDGYVLSRVLRHFRRRAAERCGCNRATRVVVTARPRLLQVIRPGFARIVRAAGFRSGRLVDEHVCLAAAVGVESTGVTLIVNVGHNATRLYGWASGAFVASRTITDVSGARMAIATSGLVRGNERLRISSVTASRLVKASGNPEAWPLAARGSDLITGHARIAQVRRESIVALLKPHFERIGGLCAEMLGELVGRAGPETRIVITGAAAAVGGLADFLGQALDETSEVARRPGEARVCGLTLAFLSD